MRRNQVFVRAISKEGKWDAVDVLDLDEDSFRAFVVSRLMVAGLVVSVLDEDAGEKIILHEKAVNDA